ncbi:MAG: CDP-alcohol phosphatidyltransferase family protein [Syntrophorhabdales bacterium]|jgi:phosphatidylglycerophosphate synthase
MVKTALILAIDKKGLQPVFGVPAVRRLVLLLSGMGLEEVHVVGNQASLSPILSDLLPSARWHDPGNPAWLNEMLKGPYFSGQVMVLKGNLVVDRGSLAEVIRSTGDTDSLVLEARRSGNGRGIYVVKKEELPGLMRALSSPGQGGGATLDRGQDVTDARGLPYLMGPERESVAIAEDGLVAGLAATTAKTDGFMARHFDRRLSRLVSRRIARTPLTPNTITLFNVVIGLAGAHLFSRRGYWAHVAGSLIFLLCVIFDGVDGEVARLKLKETVFGRYLDVITDNIVHVALFIGIALGVARETGNEQYLYVLGILLGGFALCAVAVGRVLRPGRNGIRPEALDKLTGLLANRDFAYLLIIFALLNGLEWFLISAAAGTYLFAASVFFLDLRRRKLPSPQ